MAVQRHMCAQSYAIAKCHSSTFWNGHFNKVTKTPKFSQLTFLIMFYRDVCGTIAFVLSHTHTHTHTHSQVLGIVIVFISQVLTVPMNPEMILINQCGSDIDLNSSALLSCHQSNTSVPDIIEDSLPLNQLGPAMIFTPTFTAILFVFYVVFFRPKYKRVAAERVASFEASVYVGNGQNGQTK